MFLPGCDILLLNIEKEMFDNSKIIEKGIFVYRKVLEIGSLKTNAG